MQSDTFDYHFVSRFYCEEFQCFSSLVHFQLLIFEYTVSWLFYKFIWMFFGVFRGGVSTLLRGPADQGSVFRHMLLGAYDVRCKCKHTWDSGFTPSSRKRFILSHIQCVTACTTQRIVDETQQLFTNESQSYDIAFVPLSELEMGEVNFDEHTNV